MKLLIYKTFRISILILCLFSLHAWFLWGQLYFATFLSISLTIAFVFTKKGVFSFKASNLIPILIFAIVQFYVVRDGNTNAFFLAVLRIIVISVIILLNDQIKIDLFRYITKSFAIIMFFSIVAWILFLIGFHLPHFSTEYNQYSFENYFFFLLNDLDADFPIPRFSSYFLEPGYLGMVTSFLLCANSFKLKDKYVLILFIATIFTFSLAAYLLLIISTLVYFLFYSKRKVYIILFGILVLILYLFFTNYQNGNNVVNNLIILRLQFENGEMVGYNRYGQDFISYFPDFLKNSSKVFFGIGDNAVYAMGLVGAGVKFYLVQHGIVGITLVLLFYVSFLLGKPGKMALILLLTYILCFAQAAYPLMEFVLIIFIISMPFVKLQGQILKNEHLTN